MDFIKIAIILEKRFLESCEIRQYRKQSAEQLLVRKYSINNQKIIVDEEK